MERLTHRYIGGMAWASIFNVVARGETECTGPVIDRLAAYEDTELEPEEIVSVQEEPWCVFYFNRRCNLDGDFCPEGPGCPQEMSPEDALHLLKLAKAEENPPLTIDQLREMDGEPVWVADLLIPKCSCYHFVQKIGCHTLLMEPRYYPAEDVMVPHYCANDENQGYQNTWLAYRRKPEEG